MEVRLGATLAGAYQLFLTVLRSKPGGLQGNLCGIGGTPFLSYIIIALYYLSSP